MDWQEPVALGIVSFTVVAMLVAVWRARNRARRMGGGLGCGCHAGPSATRPPQITYRARKGDRPQVVIRESR